MILNADNRLSPSIVSNSPSNEDARNLHRVATREAHAQPLRRSSTRVGAGFSAQAQPIARGYGFSNHNSAPVAMLSAILSSNRDKAAARFGRALKRHKCGKAPPAPRNAGSKDQTNSQISSVARLSPGYEKAIIRWFTNP
jgi:hypothetical protein